MNFENLQKFLSKISPGDFDLNPEGLALRILRYYRHRCETKYEKLDGLTTEELIVSQLINKMQDERAHELDRAIEILELHERP